MSEEDDVKRIWNGNVLNNHQKQDTKKRGLLMTKYLLVLSFIRCRYRFNNFLKSFFAFFGSYLRHIASYGRNSTNIGRMTSLCGPNKNPGKQADRERRVDERGATLKVH